MSDRADMTFDEMLDELIGACPETEADVTLAECTAEGAALGYGNHRHKCPSKPCGHIWEHSDACAGSDEAHRCPRCQTEQRWRYDPDNPDAPPESR